MFCWMQIIFWLCNVYFCELDSSLLDSSLKQLIAVLVVPSLFYKFQLKQGMDVVLYLSKIGTSGALFSPYALHCSVALRPHYVPGQENLFPRCYVLYCRRIRVAK